MPKKNGSSGWFTCQGCIATHQRPYHRGPGIVLQGIRYCGLCADERIDEVVLSAVSIVDLLDMYLVMTSSK